MKRKVFTLVELVVAIAIIAIIASLTSFAVIRGLNTAKQTQQKLNSRPR